MATIGAGILNIVDVVKGLNPDGSVAKVAELLNRVDEIMYDIPWVEGNTNVGEQLTLRTAIPVPVFRRMNQGIAPTKSTKAQIIEACAQLADISTVDVDVANIGGNPGAVRLSESYAHIEGMNQVFMNTLWYGSYVTPESFIGLAPRYGSLEAGNSQNIIDGGGTSSNCTSVWLIGWGPETVYGIYPKGSKGGLEHIDEGRQLIAVTAGNPGTLMPAYVDTYKWNCGIAVKDWRYVIRIANIDVNNLVGETTPTDLANKMIRAMARIPYGDRGNFSFVMNRTVYEMLAIQRREDVRAGGQLKFEEVDGKFIPMFQGIPIRKSDSILLTESQVSYPNPEDSIMAILDQQTVLWDNVALTTSAYSTNAYDSGTAGATPVSANANLRDISVGEPLAMVVFVTVAATVTGTQTYEFDVVQAATSTLSSSPDTLVQVAFTTTQATALLTAGAAIVVPIPQGSITKRYVGGHYVSANSAAISVTAAILPMRDVTIQKYYATAIVIQ